MNKPHLIFWGIVLFFGCGFILVSSTYSKDMDGYEIMLRNYNLDQGNDFKAELTMDLIKKNGKKRTRKITYWYLEKGEEDKILLTFDLPDSVKGTTFLSWAHEEKDDDQWLLLPSLKRIRRIASTEKHKPFMGTDFSYNDMSLPHPKNFTNNIIGEEQVNGINCYKIENIHKTYDSNNPSTKGDKYQYSKTISWISKENFVMVQSVMYDSDGEICKQYSASNIQKIDGYWVPVLQEMENLKNSHKTILTISNIQFNLSLTEDFFSQQQLSKML